MTRKSDKSACFTQGVLWPVIASNSGNRNQLGKGFYWKDVGKFTEFPGRLEKAMQNKNRSGGWWCMATSAKVHVGQWGRDASLVRVMEASICPGCRRSTDAGHHLWSHCPVKGKQLPWVRKQCSPLTQVSALLVQSKSLASLHDHLEL